MPADFCPPLLLLPLPPPPPPPLPAPPLPPPPPPSCVALPAPDPAPAPAPAPAAAAPFVAGGLAPGGKPPSLAASPALPQKAHQKPFSRTKRGTPAAAPGGPWYKSGAALSEPNGFASGSHTCIKPPPPMQRVSLAARNASRSVWVSRSSIAVATVGMRCSANNWRAEHTAELS